MKRYLLFFLIVAFATQKCNATAKLAHSQANLVINHLQVMRELKTLIARMKNNSCNHREYFSQTDAHLSFPFLYDTVVNTWHDFLQEQGELIDKIIVNERRHSNDFVVCYHAQRKEFLIAEDFIKEVFELLQISEQYNAFTFLRFWNKMPQTMDVNTFIDENNKKGYWDDHEPELAKSLLSVNLSLFGNCTYIGAWECTFDYFLADRSVMLSTMDLTRILNNIFDHFQFDKRYIKLLLSLFPRLKSNNGILFQVFIPKQLVDECVYLCYPGGIPFNFSLPGGNFDSNKKRNLAIGPIISLYTTGKQGIDQALEKDQTFSQTIQQGFNFNNSATWAEHVAVCVDRLQARILLTQDIMLNPASGVEIYRYTTIDDESMAEYTAKLKKLTQEIVSKWLESHENRTVIQGTKLDTLLTQLTQSTDELD